MHPPEKTWLTTCVKSAIAKRNALIPPDIFLIFSVITIGFYQTIGRLQ